MYDVSGLYPLSNMCFSVLPGLRNLLAIVFELFGDKTDFDGEMSADIALPPGRIFSLEESSIGLQTRVFLLVHEGATRVPYEAFSHPIVLVPFVSIIC